LPGGGFYPFTVNLAGTTIDLVMNGTVGGTGSAGVRVQAGGAADVEIGGDVTSLGTRAVRIISGGAATFTQTAGTIQNIGTAFSPGAGVQIESSAGVTLNTTAGALITSTSPSNDGVGLVVTAPGAVTGTLNGDISSTNADAVRVTTSGTGLVNLTFGGTITGGAGVGDNGLDISTGPGSLTGATNGAVSGYNGVAPIRPGGDLTSTPATTASSCSVMGATGV